MSVPRLKIRKRYAIHATAALARLASKDGAHHERRAFLAEASTHRSGSHRATRHVPAPTGFGRGVRESVRAAASVPSWGSSRGPGPRAFSIPRRSAGKRALSRTGTVRPHRAAVPPLAGDRDHPCPSRKNGGAGPPAKAAGPRREPTRLRSRRVKGRRACRPHCPQGHSLFQNGQHEIRLMGATGSSSNPCAEASAERTGSRTNPWHPATHFLYLETVRGPGIALSRRGGSL